MIFSVFFMTAVPLLVYLQRRAIPVWFVLVPFFLVSALQFNIGTDYFSYLSRAETGNVYTFFRKFEYLFGYITLFAHATHWPQSLFFIVVFLQLTLLYYFTRIFLQDIKIYTPIRHFILISVILFLANAAANQLNLLRFYIAIPLYGIFIIELNKGRICRAFLFATLAILNHFSFSFFVILSVFLQYFRPKLRTLILLSLTLLVISEVVLSFVMNYYTPLRRLQDGLQISINIGIVDVPGLLLYFIVLFNWRYYESDLRPFMILHTLAIFYYFGPPAISERISYLYLYFLLTLGMISFKHDMRKLCRQVIHCTLCLWFILPIYKFYFFAEKEYRYEAIL